MLPEQHNLPTNLAGVNLTLNPTAKNKLILAILHNQPSVPSPISSFLPLILRLLRHLPQ